MLTQTINYITGIGTILMQAFSVVLLVQILFFRKDTNNKILNFASVNAYLIGFLIALMSMVMSLVYSEAIGFAPCMLCWYQRIFMYPLVFLFGLALFRKEKIITNYALVLTVVGTLIAFYHNLLSWLPQGSLPCSATGPSCTILYTDTFGFITIPLMSLTGFVTVLLVLIARKRNEKSLTTPQ